MSATQHLQSLVEEDWHAATHHAFTNALAHGTLSRAKMAGYLQQDYQFIEGFVRLPPWPMRPHWPMPCPARNFWV
jgi:thiaminase/transcriptional activator TenA